MGSPSIFKSSAMLGESFTTPKGVIEFKEDILGGYIIEESKEKDKVVEADQLVVFPSVEAKKGTRIEEYTLRKEIDDLLKSPVLGGDTTN